MYYEALSSYVYELPCGVGHTFRSLTRSDSVNGHSREPEGPARSVDGAHWFYCQSCGAYVVVEASALIEHPPTSDRGRELPPGDQGRAVDAAIKRDRIAAHYRLMWDDLGVRQVAELFHASTNIVVEVATRLGVYEYSAGCNNITASMERVSTASGRDEL